MSKDKILIIEDSPSQAAILAEIVRQAGYESCVYHNVSQGVVQILLKERPVLVLLDLRILDSEGRPIADGFQVCREIKRSPVSPAVVVVSAESDESATDWAMLQGADAFLQKPFAVEDLTDVIALIMERRGA